MCLIEEIWYAMLGPEVVNLQHTQCMPLTLVCTHAAYVSAFVSLYITFKLTYLGTYSVRVLIYHVGHIKVGLND